MKSQAQTGGPDLPRSARAREGRRTKPHECCSDGGRGVRRDRALAPRRDRPRGGPDPRDRRGRSRRGERAARRRPGGCPPFGSLTAALAAGGFDAALVAVPHHLHEAVATEALDAGLHVLLEKPLAPSVEAADRILAAARNAGTVFMVAENAQYWPEVLTVRDLIRDGAIGDVVTARAATFFPALGEFYGGEQPWRFDRAAAGGGVAIDTGSHWLRPLRIWLGEVDEVVAALGYPAPRHAGRVAVPRVAALRVGRDRDLRRDAHDRSGREPAAVHGDGHQRRVHGRRIGAG